MRAVGREGGGEEAGNPRVALGGLRVYIYNFVYCYMLNIVIIMYQ